MPDGEAQVQRDAFYGNMNSIMEGVEPWDGIPVDEPPTDYMDPKKEHYFRGHNTVDFVSVR